MSEPTHILFYDLETTGTDEKLDQILEVGCLLYSIQFGTTSERSWVTHLGGTGSLRLGTNDFVRDMHTESGLIEACDAEPANVAAVDGYVRNWLNMTTGSTRHVISAGSGVSHFDRRFIREQMPLLDRSMTYWSLDVGVMRRMCELAGRSDLNLDQGTKTHRAAVDARFHYEEWRHYDAILRGAMAPVPEGALQ